MSQKIYGDLEVVGAVSSKGALLSATPTLVLKDSTGAAVEAIRGDIPDGQYGADSSVKSLVLGTSCKSIGMMAFNASGLAGHLIIPESVTVICDLAFTACNLSGALILPESVTFIGMAAFSGCDFTSVVIPASAQTVQMMAFESCTSLTDAYIDTPKSVVDGFNTFASSGLTTIHIKDPAPAGWTIGTDQTVGGKTGITVVQDWN